MVIGACGFGSTGSSVFTDLLSEYDDVQLFDSFEFVLPYRVDGLEDLEYHLVKQFSKCSSGDSAIKRFLRMSKCYKTPFIHKPCSGKTFYSLSKEYISTLEQLSYKGIETADVSTGFLLRDICAFFSKKIGMRFFEMLLHKRLYWWPGRRIHFSIHPQDFYSKTKAYTNKILVAMGANPKLPICLDQPFEGNDPEQSMKFFDDPYAVVIDKDPRDLFLEYKYNKNVDGKFYPHSTVEDFIIYYKNLRGSKKTTNRILFLHFEDFIYNYEETVKKIEDFIHLSKHSRPKSVFIPEKSINNTQLIRKHPEELQNIKKIEFELKPFLYPFENFPSPIFNGPSFTGSGRKMTIEKY